MKPYANYNPDTLANLLEQADLALEHQRRQMEDMRDEIEMRADDTG